MTNQFDEGRRRFLAGGAAAIGATTLGTVDARAAEQDADYVIDAPGVTSMEISGSKQRFPVRRVYCLGRNYRAHAIESGDDPDVNPPFFFIKPRDAVVASHNGFPYPPMTQALRYEGEMVVALKSGGAAIDPAEALDHVFAYGVGLDMTREDLQTATKELQRPWAISKSFDKSAPCGPLRTVDDIGHIAAGRIWLAVNGEVKQDSDVGLQRWSVAEGISILSEYYELMAGDIIMTGTPAGIGLVAKGDVITAGIDGVGEIEVTIS